MDGYLNWYIFLFLATQSLYECVVFTYVVICYFFIDVIFFTDVMILLTWYYYSCGTFTRVVLLLHW